MEAVEGLGHRHQLPWARFRRIVARYRPPVRMLHNWQHYIPLLQRKSGALRNGAPFADMPAPLQQLRRAMLRSSGGDRVMAQVLTIVPTAGLDAVLVFVELALETRPSGKVSVEYVIRRTSQPPSVAVGTGIAPRPPHRSVRAALPHTAPALSHDAKRSLGYG